jgi:AAA15 family ATPase/GTPase
VITSLRIQNFKAFRDQSFSLGRLNLLAGLNGSGKSSLLQALLILRQSADQGLLKHDEIALNGNLVRLGRFKDVLFESAEEQRISIELTFASGNSLSCEMSGWTSEDRTGPAEGSVASYGRGRAR